MTADRIQFTREEVEQLDRALTQARRYFEYRDDSNALIHEAETRYSPITVTLIQTCKMLDGIVDGSNGASA